MRSRRLEYTAADLSRRFEVRYGRPPRWVVAAPGRVNLIGEHTDYNDGFVLPMAIERHTLLAADLADARPARVSWYDARLRSTATIPVDARIERGMPRWSNYVRGVIAGFRDRGAVVPPLDVLMASTVPRAAGLASSAALEVATATLLEAATGAALEPREKALLCQRAEHEFVGVPCGIMDPLVAVMAREDHALLIDCRTYETRPATMMDAGVTVLIVNTGVRRGLAAGAYAERRRECDRAARILGVPALRDATSAMLDAAQAEPDEVACRRARHVVRENERTLQAAQALRVCDWPSVGRLLYESHASLRDDFEVSSPELDAVVDIARSLGVIGCRMTGAGFGGCAVALVETERLDEVRSAIGREYSARTGLEPALIVSRAAAGARVLTS